MAKYWGNLEMTAFNPKKVNAEIPEESQPRRIRKILLDGGYRLTLVGDDQSVFSDLATE